MNVLHFRLNFLPTCEMTMWTVRQVVASKSVVVANHQNGLVPNLYGKNVENFNYKNEHFGKSQKTKKLNKRIIQNKMSIQIVLVD